MNYLVTYDISETRQRSRAAKILEDFGDRVQLSVFEIPGVDHESWQMCWARLKKNITLKAGDSIRVYVLCEACRKVSEVWSPDGGEIMPDQDVIII